MVTTLEEKIFAAHLEKYCNAIDLKNNLKWTSFFSTCCTLYYRGNFNPSETEIKHYWGCKLGENLELIKGLVITHNEMQLASKKHPNLTNEQKKKWCYLLRLAKCKYFIDYIFKD